MCVVSSPVRKRRADVRPLDPDIRAERTERVVPTGVIEVEVRRDDSVDIARRDPKRRQPGNWIVSLRDLAFGGIPGLAIIGADQRGRIAGVDQVPLTAGRDDQVARHLNRVGSATAVWFDQNAAMQTVERMEPAHREMLDVSPTCPYRCSSTHGLPSANRLGRNGVRSTSFASPSNINSAKQMPVAGAVLKQEPLSPVMT